MGVPCKILAQTHLSLLNYLLMLVWIWDFLISVLSLYFLGGEWWIWVWYVYILGSYLLELLQSYSTMDFSILKLQILRYCAAGYWDTSVYTPVRKVLAQRKVLWQSLGGNQGTSTRVCQTFAAQIMMMMWLRLQNLDIFPIYYWTSGGLNDWSWGVIVGSKIKPLVLVHWWPPGLFHSTFLWARTLRTGVVLNGYLTKGG